jgi:hypothetical protein
MEDLKAMKKLFMLALPLVVFSSVSSATPACSTTGVTLATLIALGAGGCEIGDEIFANFSGSLSNVADTIAFAGPAGPVGPGNAFYSLNVNAGVNSILQGNFTFGYTVAIDTTTPGLITAGYSAANTKLTGGVQDNGNDGATLVKTVTGGATCTTGSTDSFGTIVPTTPGCNPINAQTFSVSEAFTYTGNNSNAGGARSISGIGNTITEAFTLTTGAPEPVSMLLFGSGLLAVSVLGRRKLVRK